ncbi:hypothetical protein ACFVT2_18135 [Streptomyces sp. NPDC058000]|uniref:hypothetical protein n=1 Tax=Streptomyces sp. NPDC058000 TaxID=3346299 RepID=UPI0036E71586
MPARHRAGTVVLPSNEGTTPVTVLLLDDDDVRAHLDAPTAVRAVRAALLAAHHGDLEAPPRVRAGLGDGDLVVIVATGSATPVLDADWLAPGTHVTTLGPKSAARHEVPAPLADRARTVLTDSLSQSAGFPEPPLFPTDRLVSLGAVLAGAAPARTGPDDLTVFSSVGLAGTEVAVAAALCEAVPR